MPMEKGVASAQKGPRPAHRQGWPPRRPGCRREGWCGRDGRRILWANSRASALARAPLQRPAIAISSMTGTLASPSEIWPKPRVSSGSLSRPPSEPKLRKLVARAAALIRPTIRPARRAARNDQPTRVTSEGLARRRCRRPGRSLSRRRSHAAASAPNFPPAAYSAALALRPVALEPGRDGRKSLQEAWTWAEPRMAALRND